MNQSASQIKKLTLEYLTFLTKISSLHLSTIGKNGRPESSYAPFVIDQNNNFYIYISSLASHTGNMLDDGRAGIMLIEEEEEGKNIFARRRVTFECNVELLKRETEDWMGIMLLFDKLAPEQMETLRRLTDFQLLRLLPKSGLFVKGFGKSYKISGDRMDELTHINPLKNN